MTKRQRPLSVDDPFTLLELRSFLKKDPCGSPSSPPFPPLPLFLLAATRDIVHHARDNRGRGERGCLKGCWGTLFKSVPGKSIIAVSETKIDLGEAVPGKLTALCKKREEIESRKSSSFEYLINVKFEF